MAARDAAPPALSFLLDTNIISELARPQPHATVLRLFAAHHAKAALSTPVWHELQLGCLRLPTSERRTALQDFVDHVAGALPKLAYDAKAALVHAQLRAHGQSQGRVLPFLDAQIAAIAIAQGLTLVTRNTRDFESLPGLRLANWFQG